MIQKGNYTIIFLIGAQFYVCTRENLSDVIHDKQTGEIQITIITTENLHIASAVLGSNYLLPIGHAILHELCIILSMTDEMYL